MKREITNRGIIAFAFLSLPLLFSATVHAERFTSPSYTIDASGIGASLAGPQSSASYQLTSSGGESVIGDGTSGSYKLGEGYVAQLEQSIELTVQPGSMGLYASMDEDSGPVNDSSINTAQATFVGAPTRTTGKIGKAITTSSGNSVEFAKSSANSPTAAITLETWVNPTDILNINSQKFISSTETGGISLFVTGTSTDVCAALKICFAFYSGGAYRFVAVDKTYLANGTWAHIAATYDGTTARLYVNGVERGTTSHSGTISYNATSPLCIGSEAMAASCAGGGYFIGALDEVKLFGRGLTSEEVQAEYAAQNAGIPSGLSLNTISPGVSQTAPFDAAIEIDSPGYGYNLSISQNQNLTSGANTIPAITGSIASPVTWTEGTTKGLGFTLYGTNATAIPGKWLSGSAYAALPGASTAFYARTDYSAGIKDVLNMRLRVDVPVTQAPGSYANQMTISGTMTP